MQKKNRINTLNVRQSNFELLRILCILGIITMHTWGMFYGNATGLNLTFGVLINSLFNTGVSIFMLISGYFGISWTVKKYLRLEMKIIFYSVLSMLVISYMQNSWNLKDVAKAFLPVVSGRYWYITSYVLIFIFSKFLNRVPEILGKKEFKKLLFLMFLVFSIIPTIVQFDIMNDGGKGVINMLLMYYIGRYIKLYWDEKDIRLLKTILIGIATTVLGFSLNYFLTMARGGKGVYAPFARDCSSIIIVASIMIFMRFKYLKISSMVINHIAKHVIAVYLFEGAVRTVINCFFDMSKFAGRWYLFVVIGIYALIVMTGCMLIDVIRDFIAAPIENFICSFGHKSFEQILEHLNKYMK